MDWGAAARYAAVGAGLIGAGFVAVGLFYRFWDAAGVFAAIALVGLLLYLAYAWSKRRAERERKKLERNSPR
jgi:hypothetical protein